MESKKLIFCFDGTGNDPLDAADFLSDSSISNVLKLHALFGGSLGSNKGGYEKMANQLSFYYSGIGTRGGWLRRIINKAIAPPSADMKDILADAKKDLEENHTAGDEVYIFGFSRGAAIARIFAAEYVGDRQIRFLGVFDTVAATKGSLDLDKDTYPASGVIFEDGTLGGHIKEAVHLLSIDERRLAFQPTLINTEDDKKRITEVWFAGVHSDIGGGYWFDGLSDITLDYMRQRAKAVGLEVLGEEEIDYDCLQEGDGNEKESLCRDDIAVIPLPKGHLHEQYRQGIAAKTLAPRLVRVNRDDKHSNKDIPIIHHTVCERFGRVTGYRPCNLRDLTFRIMDKSGEVGEKSYKGICGLGEAYRESERQEG